MEARLSHFKRKRITDETPFHLLDQQKNMCFFFFLYQKLFFHNIQFSPKHSKGRYQLYSWDLSSTMKCFGMDAMLDKPKSMKRVISAFSVNSVMPCKSAIIIHLLKIVFVLPYTTDLSYCT